MEDLFLAKDWLIARNLNTDIMITGLRGTGKTSAALSIIYEHCKEHNVKFEVAKDMILSSRINPQDPEILHNLPLKGKN